MIDRRNFLAGAMGLTATALAARPAHSQARSANYGPGVSDTEIRIGHTNAFSGPVSAFSAIGVAMEAYFRSINDAGGINGRKLVLLTEDDQYSPPKTVEATRKLVERDEVLFMAAGMGTPTQSAVQPYLNGKKVPQLFVLGGASKWGRPRENPWTIGWSPTYASEAGVYARHILANRPDAKIAVFYANDDFGKDYLEGLKQGLGDKVGMIVAEASAQATDATVDSPIAILKASGADVLVNAGPGKGASQAIRVCAQLGWKPLHYLNNNSTGIRNFLEPAGLENAEGIITALYRKDPNDPRWKDDAGMNVWREWMAKYNPSESTSNDLFVQGYSVAQTICQVLTQCGDELTRENIMRQAAALRNFELPLNLPGITLNTSESDFYPMEAMQLARFNTERWELFGETIDTSDRDG